MSEAHAHVTVGALLTSPVVTPRQQMHTHGEKKDCEREVNNKIRLQRLVILIFNQLVLYFSTTLMVFSGQNKTGMCRIIGGQTHKVKK